MDIADRVVNDGVYMDQELANQINSEFRYILRSFSLSVLHIDFNITRDCARLGEPDGPQYEWSLTNSFVFAMTVTTTIGLYR